MNLNKVILIGRLAADPESRTTNTGQDVSNIRLVTNRVWTDPNGQKQEQAEFHTVVLWGRLAQIANQYLKKGGLVMIEGRLQTRSWMGNDNQKKYRTEIVGENIQLGPRSANSGGSYNSNAGPSSNTRSGQSSGQKFTSASNESKEEDIPVINEDEPIITDDELEETKVDIKDIPF